jgi:Family of unknown function (DUF6309)
MQVLSKASFQEVREAFLRENDIHYDKNPWALGAIDAAEQQFGHWARVILNTQDILGIMLPHHTRCGPEVVPVSCSTVSEAMERLKSLPSDNPCNNSDNPCNNKVENLSSRPPSLIFLSAAPINHPEYPEYQPLVKRNYKGLTHLDGLHRLIAWGRSGTSGIVAYVAGLASESNDAA